MSEVLNPKEFFIPMTTATGNYNAFEAAMMLRFTGFEPVILEDGKERISLANAIEWNKKEILSSEGVEKEFREALVKEFAGMVYIEAPFSEETLILQAKLFSKQAKEFYKKEKNVLSVRAVRILKNAGII